MSKKDKKKKTMDINHVKAVRKEYDSNEDLQLAINTKQDYFLKAIQAMGQVFSEMYEQLNKNGRVHLELECRMNPPKVECFVMSKNIIKDDEQGGEVKKR